jgi:hypothetical protein
MRSRLLASVIVAGAALAFTPAAALAGETHYFNTDGGPIPDWSKGYIRAAVTVEFLSKKTFDVSGWVEDVCPKDGDGGYVMIDTGLGDNITAQDTNGCDNGKVNFDPAPVKKNVDVRYVRATVCEKDGDGNTGTKAGYYCASYTFNNWRL